jgi:hypothetical protein
MQRSIDRVRLACFERTTIPACLKLAATANSWEEGPSRYSTMMKKEQSHCWAISGGNSEGLRQGRRRCGHSDGLGGHQVQANALEAAALHLNGAGGTVGKIDNPAVDHRPAIIDSDYYCSPVAKVGHLHEGTQRQRRVRCGEIVHIVRFAARCRLAFEVFSVPGSYTNLIWPGTVFLAGTNYDPGLVRSSNGFLGTAGFRAVWSPSGSGPQAGDG